MTIKIETKCFDLSGRREAAGESFCAEVSGLGRCHLSRGWGQHSEPQPLMVPGSLMAPAAGLGIEHLLCSASQGELNPTKWGRENSALPVPDLIS